MRIGLNLLYLIPGITAGTRTYGVSLIRALAAMDDSNEYYVFLNKEGASLNLSLPGNFHLIVCNFRGRCRPLRYAWEQIVLPFQLRALKTDVVHSLGYVGPLMSPCPSVVTIHDVNFIALRSNMTILRRSSLRFFSTRSGLRSAHVITISNFSKTEIVRALGLEPAKISVTYLGPKEWAFENEAVPWEKLKRSYFIREPYIVAFGGSARHKNTARLIEAYGSLEEKTRHQLVIIGRLHPDINIRAVMERWGLAGNLIVTGHVPEEHILPLLRHARLFVLPSLYEGFGLPLLEAQQAGVPIVSSSAAALPEVGGAGAFYFDPTSINELTNALYRGLTDESLRSQLIQRGKENLGRFSWKKTAQATLKIYEDVCRAFS